MYFIKSGMHFPLTAHNSNLVQCTFNVPKSHMCVEAVTQVHSPIINVKCFRSILLLKVRHTSRNRLNESSCPPSVAEQQLSEGPQLRGSKSYLRRALLWGKQKSSVLFSVLKHKLQKDNKSTN